MPEHPELEGKTEGQASLIRNPVSLIGAALTGTSLATILFLLFVNFVSAQPSPYVGFYFSW